MRKSADNSCLLSVAEYRAKREKIEMPGEIRTAMSQLAEGKGVNQKVAKIMVLESLKD